MNLDIHNRNATSTIVGSACMFAAAFWLLDAGSVLWRSNAGLLSAIAPEGSQFLLRVLYAAIFAVAGSIVGAAVQRGRDIEESALDKLKEGECKYHALLASSFDNVLTLSKDARLVELSDSAAALFCVTGRAMTGMALDDFVEIDAGMNPQLSNCRLIDLLQDAATQQQQCFAVRGRTQNGRRFPAEIRITPMPPGGASAYLLSVRETTSSVVAQKALQHSERRYQALFDNIPDGVFRSLPDGHLLAANPALAEMLGYDSADELIAEANASDLYHDPQQRKAMLGKLQESGQVRNREIRLRRRDGSVVPALANVRALISDNNDDLVFEGTLTDISDLIEARNTLQESEEHFRALCEHSLDAIHVIDAAGNILYNSPSSILFTNRTTQDQRDLQLFSCVHPDDAEAVRSAVAEGFARPGAAQRFSCRVLGGDGSMHHIDAAGTAFLTSHGELRAVISFRDIGEQLKTAAKLREMQKIQVVDSLATCLTREFNSLLTTMSSNLQLLDERIEDPTLRARLSAASEACRRSTDITRRMMAFADRADARPDNVEVNAMLQDIAPVLQRSLGNEVAINTSYANDLWQVRVDPAQFESNVLQLAVNASEALMGSGTLTIRTRNHRAGQSGADVPQAMRGVDAISISIGDNGKGMSNEVLARATDPFFSATDAAGHIGLGLSTARQFAENAGGELTISSQVAEGTVVTLFLPRAATGHAQGIAGARPVPCGTERVLVVEENDHVRRATAELLASVGYAVIQAEDGSAALQTLQTDEVDLLLADLTMTQLSGLELAERVRAAHPQTKILLMSGIDAADPEAHERLNPPYELIRKPFRRQRLAEQVRLVLET